MLQLEHDGPVTLIGLNRKEVRNAVDRRTAEELAAAFRDFDADENARVGVLHGEHGAFCSGADLKAIARGDLLRLDPEGDGPMGPSRMVLSKPVIAAIEGPAVAGGLELSLFCDLRIAAEGSVFGVFCRRWGVPLIDGGTVRLPRLIGLSHALDLILTGRAVLPDEARSMGLVNRVVPKGEAKNEARKLAHELASLPQTCMRNDRRSAYEQVGLTLEAALLNEFRLGMESLNTEAAEGAKAFANGAGRHGARIA